MKSVTRSFRTILLDRRAKHQKREQEQMERERETRARKAESDVAAPTGGLARGSRIGGGPSKSLRRAVLWKKGEIPND